MSEMQVREAFAAQAGFCEALGSPFTALLCRVVGERLDRGTEVGRRILDWQGDPSARADSVPLRLAGGLHALVRRDRLPGLAALYPPNPMPEPDALRASVDAVLREASDEIGSWLDGPPQTNEVARSAVLMAGLLVVAAETGLPITLTEIGASAGLNLILDRYAYDLGGLRTGTAGSALALAPAWEGPPPPDGRVRIAERRGADLNPLDVTAAADRERLLAYVWADQEVRLRRIAAALAIAPADPPAVDRADAALWLPQRLAAPWSGAQVVMHSIALQYFPDAARERVVAALEEAGARASTAAPLAWLRYEVEPELKSATLRLRLWPDGGDRLLALADPHGRKVTWRA